MPAPADRAGAGELIPYCTVGVRACTAWFALTYLLGREDVRVYDGSWAEWAGTPTAPPDSNVTSARCVTARIIKIP